MSDSGGFGGAGAFGGGDFGSGNSAPPTSDHGDAGAKPSVPIMDEAALKAREEELAKNLAKAKEHGWTDPVPFDYSGGPVQPAGDEEELGEPEWLANAAVYEWEDEFGDVGPVNAELERQLFRGEYLMKAGGAIKALEFEVLVEGPHPIHPVRAFQDAGLHPVMAENVRLCQYKIPTPIQCYTIPSVLMGYDIVGCAQTGSGKTAAYLIPILSKLMGKAKMLCAPKPNPRTYIASADRVRAEPLVLIVCPTRELACQIFDEARRLCYRTMLRPCVVYGGAPTRGQREQLERGCDVLIATPGRLLDFMNNLNMLSFSRLKFTVLDEADELLSAGWEEAIDKLFHGSDMNADADHTYMMFSATFPKAARQLAKECMADDYVRIKVGRIGSTHENIKQSIVWVEDHMKDEALVDLIFARPPARTIVFVNSKMKADRVDDLLYNKGLPSTSIHSDRTQREREDALRAFKLAKAPILVATGVTARGLDVANVKHIINYELPSTAHDGITEYVHRIGRTARIGNDGTATSFYNGRNEDIAEDLVKILIENKQELPDFLEQLRPEKVEWHDDTDDSDEEGGVDSGGGFDAGGTGGFDDGPGFQPDNGGFQAEGFEAEADKTAAW